MLFIILIPLAILVAIGAILVITVVLFRSAFRAVFGRRRRRVVVASRVCNRRGCRASNVATARYCRRCGQQLMTLSSSVVMAA
ncbi:MAG TPA: hypothetical protein VFW23_19420 [Tepidisphaeraceae bacterium]|nr:hypothetical protein [Tepidisphaeraceae bacterium]